MRFLFSHAPIAAQTRRLRLCAMENVRAIVYPPTPALRYNFRLDESNELANILIFSCVRFAAAAGIAQGIVAIAAPERIASSAAVDHIIARHAEDFVAIAAPVDGVVAVTAEDDVFCPFAEDYVITAPAEDQVQPSSSASLPVPP